MASPNLDSMSLTELKKLSKAVTRAIEGYDTRQKAKAVVALEEKAKEFGFTLSDLLSEVGAKSKPQKSGSTRAKPQAKYASPSDPSITWSGRGRKPSWFKEALAAGKSPETMLI